MFEVIACGTHSKRKNSFTYKQGKLFDCSVLVFFHTPALCNTKHGIQKAPASSFILYSPEDDKWHKADKNQPYLINDWLFFRDNGITEKYKIPSNVVCELGNIDFATNAIRTMCLEFAANNNYYKEKIESVFSSLLIDLSRLTKSGFRAPLPLLQHFMTCRDSIFQNSAGHWDLEKMAELYGYSVSRFAALYREFFKNSPMDDLINFRLSTACAMLLEGHDTIEKIAYECGFNSSNYFIRCFKQRIGLTPAAFRKNVK